MDNSAATLSESLTHHAQQLGASRRLLLASPPDAIDALRSDPSPPFILHAARTFDAGVIYMLIHEFHFSPSVGYGDLGNALHCAIDAGNTPVVELLLTLPVDVCGAAHRSHVSKSSALHVAARRGDTLSTRLLLEAMPTLVHATDCRGDTPLHVAVKSRHLAVARLLLAFGASRSAVNASYQAPWMNAVVAGSIALLSETFTSTKDRIYFTPIEFAINCAELDDTRTAEIVEHLVVRLGESVNGINERGETAMHLAQRRKKLATAAAIRQLMDAPMRTVASPAEMIVADS